MTLALRPLRGFQAAPPLPQPLAMPDQPLDWHFRDPAAPGVAPRHSRAARAAVMLIPLAVAAGFAWAQAAALAGEGAEGLVLAILSGMAVFWLAQSTVTALIGAFRPVAPRPSSAVPGLRVAILVPVYGEDAADVIGRAAGLLDRLNIPGHAHRFSLHVLSDTRDARKVLDEAAIAARLSKGRGEGAIQYRHRARNTDYKQGNIRDWMVRQGAAFDAALILDADSVMGAETVLAMADALVSDPGCGLVQSSIMVVPGETVWQRLQSFANRVYGGPLGRGYAHWTGSEGNFMGHNAMVRVRAFAASAGLPHLSGPRPLGGVIQSHDFVEAALLRRAGWGVRILPEAADSHEEAPETLAGHIRRDARWCQGNLQHVRLLTVPGLHWVSRFHLLSGAMAYLGSALWLAILCLGVVTGGGGPLLALAVLALLLAPRLIGLIDHIIRVGVPRGNRMRFAATAVIEFAVATLVAPVMLVQHVMIIARACTGFDAGWMPHEKGALAIRRAIKLHGLETGLGVALLVGIEAGVLSLWLAPVVLGLLLSAPVAVLVGRKGDWLAEAGWRA
jgi:membrane glycosyltransferase